MKKIAACGIDCTQCDAYVATVANDIKLKEDCARKWSSQNCTFSAEEIECHGCQASDWKMTQCCEIKACAMSRGYNFCSYCGEYPCVKFNAPSEILDKIKQAHTLVHNSTIAYLSSVNNDGYPEGRAMLNMEANGLETIWFSTNTPSPKVAQFRQNPKASVLYTDNTTYEGVTLIGDIEVLCDQQSKDRLWRQGFEMYYPKGVTDPDYSVLKFTTKWVSYYKMGLLQFEIPGNNR